MERKVEQRSQREKHRRENEGKSDIPCKSESPFFGDTWKGPEPPIDDMVQDYLQESYVIYLIQQQQRRAEEVEGNRLQ